MATFTGYIHGYIETCTRIRNRCIVLPWLPVLHQCMTQDTCVPVGGGLRYRYTYTYSVTVDHNFSNFTFQVLTGGWEMPEIVG